MYKAKVVIGTWPLSGDFGNVDLSTVHEVLCQAYDLGLREFDTAPNYGNGFAEIALGKTFLRRADVLIHTKFGNLPFGGKSFRPHDLEASIEQSLKRLRRDSVDILFLHNPRQEIVDYDPIIELFEQLKAKGWIRRAGISLAKNYNYPEEVLSCFDVIQDDANLLSLRSLDIARSFKGEFYARSPLASGLLGGRIGPQTTFTSDDHRSGWLYGDRLASLLRRVSRIEKEAGMPIASVARKFLFSRSEVTKVIFGVKRRVHLEELLQDADSGIESDLLARLEELSRRDFGLLGEERFAY